MPSSRSAKDICREQGEGSISCNVAKDRERRQRVEGRAPATPPPPAPPEDPEKISPFDRERQLQERIRRAGG